MDTFFGLLIGFFLVAITVFVHYELLRATSKIVPRWTFRGSNRMLLVIAVLFIAHLIEIGLYAVGYYVMNEQLHLGSLGGELKNTALDYFYFSNASFTTLGIGDIYPTGPIRLVAGIESLNGFVLIGWSASFTYLEMERLWGKRG